MLPLLLHLNYFDTHIVTTSLLFDLQGYQIGMDVTQIEN
jgi:hypothetical protein